MFGMGGREGAPCSQSPVYQANSRIVGHQRGENPSTTQDLLNHLSTEHFLGATLQGLGASRPYMSVSSSCDVGRSSMLGKNRYYSCTAMPKKVAITSKDVGLRPTIL